MYHKISAKCRHLFVRLNTYFFYTVFPTSDKSQKSEVTFHLHLYFKSLSKQESGNHLLHLIFILSSFLPVHVQYLSSAWNWTPPPSPPSSPQTPPPPTTTQSLPLYLQRQCVCKSMCEAARERKRECGLLKSGYICVRVRVCVCAVVTCTHEGKRLMLCFSLCGR